MQTVSFTQMADGTAEEYAFLDELEAAEMREFPDRVLEWLKTMDEPAGYQITRLEHCLQAATRALRAGEDEEMVVCRSEEHTSELQSRGHLVCRLLLEKKNNTNNSRPAR